MTSSKNSAGRLVLQRGKQRVRVERVLGALASGCQIEEIVAEWPFLTPADIARCVEQDRALTQPALHLSSRSA